MYFLTFASSYKPMFTVVPVISQEYISGNPPAGWAMVPLQLYHTLVGTSMQLFFYRISWFIRPPKCQKIHVEGSYNPCKASETNMGKK